jgi:hypothetical protein
LITLEGFEKAFRYIDLFLEGMACTVTLSALTVLFGFILALALAILGRITEARSVLASARALPLCESCSYCSCKDADIYEAYIEEITGNGKKAMELHLAGKKNWPDELDFHAGVTRLKKNKKG